MKAKLLALALALSAVAQTSHAAGFESMCSSRVDREIASVYIQEAGVWRKKVGDKYTTRVGIKVWDIYKSCFILQEKANITVTVKSSGGGFVTRTIHWDPRANLKGGWRYVDIDNLFLKDCGKGFTFHVHSYCE